jgi:uncharacterized protein YggE
MAYRSAALGAALLLVVAGVGGIVAASTDGPVAQTGNTPTAIPQESPTATPDDGTPTATPDDGTPTATPDDESPDDETPSSETPAVTPDESPTPDEPPTPEETPAGDNGAPASPAVGSAGNTTISVSASASTSTAPDTAVLRAAVVATAPDAETARRQVAENVTRTRNALDDAGVAADRIRTARFDIETVREPADNGTQVRYRAVNEFEIEVPPERAGEIIDVAVGNGTNQIAGVTFTMSDETRRQLRQAALADAVANARSDADVIASASGLTVTGVESASTADVVFMPFESAAAGSAADAGTAIEPGPVEVSATVSVTYRAE